MISVKEALDRVTAGVTALPPELVALPHALGRVLTEDMASRVNQPPLAVSSMDGYALRAEDLDGEGTALTLIGESAAGHPFDGVVGPGQTARIFTGAPVPAGADTVIMQEDTEVLGDGRVRFDTVVGKGNFIRPAGMDFSRGDVLLRAGKVLTSRDIGLAAAMNVPWLKVARRPRIAILATGDEVMMPGEPLGESQILSSNSLSLAAMVTALGGEAVNLGIARDDQDSLELMAAGAKGADLLVTIGGASVGDYDLVRQVLGEQGLELSFYKVAMKPGKPLIFGSIQGTPMLGLPGNPVSANVTALIFLRAAMEVMLGLETADEPLPTAVLGCAVPANGSRQEYMRATLSYDANGDAVALPFDKQDSAMLARFAQADCLIIRPPHAPAADKGERVEVMPLRYGLTSV